MNLIKKGNILFLTALLTLCFTSCKKSSDTVEYGNWVKKSTFDGNSRSGCASFTIGNKGYLVCGYDGDNYLKETWEYNADDNSWREVADFPGTGRAGATGFAVNGKGYVGTGYDGTNRLKDFYEYDPTSNSWSKKADFGGTSTDPKDIAKYERVGAIGFAIGNYGYIGTGYNGSEQKDFWKYNPTSDTWGQTSGFGGEKRKYGSVFIINNVAYIGLGVHNGTYEKDFYSFNGTEWKKLSDLDDDPDDPNDFKILLSNGAAFSLNGKGYITTGIAGNLTNATWEYIPATDTWNESPVFEGVARQDASTFTFKNKAFVLMGKSGSYRFDDVWEYRPDQLVNDKD